MMDQPCGSSIQRPARAGAAALGPQVSRVQQLQGAFVRHCQQHLPADKGPSMLSLNASLQQVSAAWQLQSQPAACYGKCRGCAELHAVNTQIACSQPTI